MCSITVKSFFNLEIRIIICNKGCSESLDNTGSEEFPAQSKHP